MNDQHKHARHGIGEAASKCLQGITGERTK